MTRENSTEMCLEMVAPPKQAFRYPESELLGLLPELRIDAKRRGGWRCCQCSEYQKKGNVLVWVPDAVMMRDDADAISDICRRNAYNGESQGWCLKCARQLGRGNQPIGMNTIMFATFVVAVFVLMLWWN